MTKYFKQITVLIVLATIAVNALAEALPINGISTAAISDMYRTLVTPAGYVFAIWGVIYVGWLAYAAYPFLSKKSMDWMLPAFPYFVVAAIANMVWLVLWHYQQVGWSVLVMLVLLGSLLMAYLKLEIGVYPASFRTKWMVHVPISIYLGWISVATIANVSSALVQVNWGRFGLSTDFYAGLVLLVAILLGMLMLRLKHDFAYAAVIIWALVGIAVNNGSSNLVVTVASLGVISLALFALNQYLMPTAKPNTATKSKAKAKKK